MPSLALIYLISQLYKFQIAEKGAPVGLKEVFDRTHMVKTPTGMAYVNENAEKKAVRTFSYKVEISFQFPRAGSGHVGGMIRLSQ